MRKAIGLFVNDEPYWIGKKSEVDNNLLLDIVKEASENDNTIYTIEDVEIIEMEDSND